MFLNKKKIIWNYSIFLFDVILLKYYLVIIILWIFLRNYFEYILDLNYIFFKDEYDWGKLFKLNYIIIYKYYLFIYIFILINLKIKFGEND